MPHRSPVIDDNDLAERLALRVLTSIIAVNVLIIFFAVGLGLSVAGKPARYFGEGRFITLISCMQLLAVAAYSSRVFVARRERAPCVGPISAAWVWMLISGGFLFLAADEALEIHERTDRFIHTLFQIRETPVTDRIDDVLIGLYGLIGLGVLGLFRNEVGFVKHARRPFRGGFVCLFISVLCDTASNDERILMWLCDDAETVKRLIQWISVGDGALTLLSEGFFVAAFYLVHRAAAQGEAELGGMPGQIDMWQEDAQ